MKEPLKVGDLVRQRGTERRFVIVDIEGVHAFVQLEGTDRNWGTLHIELLKRLKPKRKAREFWIEIRSDRVIPHLSNPFFQAKGEVIHVREVLKRAKA